ncbi:MAG: polysaccharide pyruvyl transferase family protein [Myxococcales bacterium]|nr:polysaccharide pyruvyl transferase family protein [Myxococcales bacterium]
MRIFVTGLCLQGNKGGPALALSLMSALEPHLPGSEYVFSVPLGGAFFREQRWGRRYGVEVVEDFQPADVLDPRAVARIERPMRASRWMSALASSDLLLEMSAISYVGPPSATRSALVTPRPRYCAVARAMGKPFLPWTQSYGPFSDRTVRLLARADLGRVPVVFCRGEETRAEVQALLPGKPTEVYPDVAVTLPFDREAGRDYIDTHHPALRARRLVTISASAVVEGHEAGRDGVVQSAVVADLAVELVGRGYGVLLVPHTYRPDDPEPRRCDHALSREIMAAVPAELPIGMVMPDLCPTELKGIISCAHIHVGGRYHSIVASLSSGVPCISLSWHHKYRDIMSMYGVGQYVAENVEGFSAGGLRRLFDQVEGEHETLQRRIVEAQPRMAAEVDRNAARFAELVR